MHLQAGFDVYVVEDAIGGRQPDRACCRHASGWSMAGIKPITVIGLAGELQRDWARPALIACVARSGATLAATAQLRKPH